MALGDQARRLVYAQTIALTISTTTTARRFTLPDGAIPIRVTCFTAATSAGATLDVGTVSDDDAFVSALDVSVTGMSTGTLLNVTETARPTDVYAHIGGGPVGGGGFTVIFEFLSVKSTGPK